MSVQITNRWMESELYANCRITITTQPSNVELTWARTPSDIIQL